MSNIYCQLLHPRKPVEATKRVSTEPVEQMPVCDKCWELLNGKGTNYRIVHYDPTDQEGGLQVIDQEGRRVPEEKLWFYQGKRATELEQLGISIGLLVLQIREKEWKLAQKVYDAYDNKNIDDIYEFLSENLVDSATAKRYRRVINWLKENTWKEKVPDDIAQIISPDDLDSLRKMSYRELVNEVPKLGPHLKKGHGS